MTAIKTFEAAGSFVTARDADDNLIVVAPVDHLLWTEALDQVIAQIDSASEEQGGHEGKKLLLSGTISDAARQNLESRDWDVTDQMRMEEK